MATTSNVTILYGEDDALNKLHMPIASATVIARGDLMEYESGAVTVVDAAGDNVTFVGVSLDLSRNGDTDDVNILLRGKLNLTVASATYAIGKALKYSSGANGTDWVLTGATSGADGIAWSAQYKGSSVTNLDVFFDSFLVGAGIGSGSGVWEGFAS
jgi:hypothetical protein